MPADLDDIPWAGDERPLSTHTAGIGGFLRFNAPQLGLALITLGIGGLLLGVHFAKGPQTNTLLPGLVFAACALPCLVWAIVRFARVVGEARVYDDGVVWRSGRGWVGLRWDEIDEVCRTKVSVNGGISARHIALRSGRRKVVLEHALSSWGRLADRVEREATARLVPEALQRLHDGDKVRFGEVAIEREGLTIERKFVAFGDMKDVRIANGSLVVFLHGRKGDVKSASLAGMPNALVFLKLLEQSDAPALRLGPR